MLKFSKSGREHFQRTFVKKCESLILLHALPAHFQRTNSICTSGRWINVFFQDILLLANMCLSNLSLPREKNQPTEILFALIQRAGIDLISVWAVICSAYTTKNCFYPPVQEKQTFHTYSDLWIFCFFFFQETCAIFFVGNKKTSNERSIIISIWPNRLFSYCRCVMDLSSR